MRGLRPSRFERTIVGRKEEVVPMADHSETVGVPTAPAASI
jgi:hypothetical protein